MVSEAIAKGDVAALNYFIADKYIKAFGQLADSPNQKIVMLPIEAMSILGSLAGIGEIAKATFGESAASAAGRRGGVLGAERRTEPAAGDAATPSAATLEHDPETGNLAQRESYGRVDDHSRSCFSTLGTWNWLIFGFVLMALELLAPGVFMFWLGLAALLVGLAVVCDQSVLADAAPDVRGVRGRRGAAVAALRAQQQGRSQAIRSSTSAPMRWSAGCSRWKSRSSTARARCGSTTRSGASPVPTRRPAAASRSCRPMAPA
jgi:hypothetical protein